MSSSSSNKKNNNRVEFIPATDLYKPIPLLKKPYGPFRNKVHVSTWFITLNSNLSEKNSYKLNSIEVFSYLEEILKNLFQDPEKLVQFLQFNPKYIDTTEYQLTESMLKDPYLFPDIPDQINSNSRLMVVRETGSEKGRLHLHAEFRIIHYTILWIDYYRLQAMVNEELTNLNTPFDSVYLNLRYVNSDLPLVNYMLKEGNIKKKNKITREIYTDSEAGYEDAVEQFRKINI